MPTYGRVHVPEPFHNLRFVHRHAGEPLREVAHPIPLAVLEQENFGAQGITTAQLVPGAPRVDALGNCVLNAGTAAVSCLGQDVYDTYVGKLLGGTGVVPFSDSVIGEEASIVGYHECTDQTGTTAQEWPPTDCGSSGVYLVEFLRSLGTVSGQRIAHTAQDIVSLLQSAPVLVGGPWFNSWETPGPLGMIDGNGTSSDLEAAIKSGVAGGHERLEWQVETLTLTATDQVTPAKTILVDRNSWGRTWGDEGNYRTHLSTQMWLANYCDWRSLVA